MQVRSDGGALRPGCMRYDIGCSVLKCVLLPGSLCCRLKFAGVALFFAFSGSIDCTTLYRLVGC